MLFFKVDQRSLRDRLKKLLKVFVEKKNKEEKASGIDTTEHTELDDLLLEIYELQKQSDTVAATSFENKTLKQNKERLQ